MKNTIFVPKMYTSIATEAYNNVGKWFNAIDKRNVARSRLGLESISEDLEESDELPVNSAKSASVVATQMFIALKTLGYYMDILPIIRTIASQVNDGIVYEGICLSSDDNGTTSLSRAISICNNVQSGNVDVESVLDTSQQTASIQCVGGYVQANLDLLTMISQRLSGELSHIQPREFIANFRYGDKRVELNYSILYETTILLTMLAYGLRQSNCQKEAELIESLLSLHALTDETLANDVNQCFGNEGVITDAGKAILEFVKKMWSLFISKVVAIAAKIKAMFINDPKRDEAIKLGITYIRKPDYKEAMRDVDGFIFYKDVDSRSIIAFTGSGFYVTTIDAFGRFSRRDAGIDLNTLEKVSVGNLSAKDLLAMAYEDCVDKFPKYCATVLVTRHTEPAKFFIDLAKDIIGYLKDSYAKEVADTYDLVKLGERVQVSETVFPELRKLYHHLADIFALDTNGDKRDILANVNALKHTLVGECRKVYDGKPKLSSDAFIQYYSREVECDTDTINMLINSFINNRLNLFDPALSVMMRETDKSNKTPDTATRVKFGKRAISAYGNLSQGALAICQMVLEQTMYVNARTNSILKTINNQRELMASALEKALKSNQSNSDE